MAVRERFGAGASGFSGGETRRGAGRDAGYRCRGIPCIIVQSAHRALTLRSLIPGRIPGVKAWYVQAVLIRLTPHSHDEDFFLGGWGGASGERHG